MVKIYCRAARRFQIFFILLVIGINIFAQSQQKSQLVVKSQPSLQQKTYENVKTLSQKIDTLQKELEQTKQQLDQLSQDVNETSASLIELNRKVEKVNNDIIDILKKIESLSQEISYIKNENLKFQQSLDELGRLQQSVQSKNVNLSTESLKVSTIPKLELDDFEILNKKIEELKKEVEEIKETQKLTTMAEIKDPNLRRIVSSPYLVLTTLLISIFALIAAF